MLYEVITSAAMHGQCLDATRLGQPGDGHAIAIGRIPTDSLPQLAIHIRHDLRQGTSYNFV